jgi:hypothetical protein
MSLWFSGVPRSGGVPVRVGSATGIVGTVWE